MPEQLSRLERLEKILVSQRFLFEKVVIMLEKKKKKKLRAVYVMLPQIQVIYVMCRQDQQIVMCQF